MKGLLAGFAGLLLLTGVMPVTGNHIQTDTGKSIVFDHRTGNDFWVEVLVSGSSASQVTKVDVQTEFDRLWKPLEKKSWGPWAGSHHLPSHETVRFRATFADGTQAVSCWFEHPEGTERCLNPPPPSTWTARKMFTSHREPSGLAKVQIAMGDVNRNGRDEVFVPTEDGVYVHERDATGAWTEREILPSFGGTFVQSAVADLDGDAEPEAYSTGRNREGRSTIYMHEFNGVGWESNLVATTPWPLRSIAVGDIEEDGRQGLYIGSSDGFSNQATYLVQVHPEHGHQVLLVSQLMHSLVAVGDADRDGDDELYSAGWGNEPTVMKLDFGGVWYNHETLPIDNSIQAYDIVAKDGDGDGQEELYVLRVRTVGVGPSNQAQESSSIFRHSPREDGWTTTEISLGLRLAFDLVHGDADNDGKRELYAVDEDGRIRQVRWTGSAWSVTTVAQVGSGEPLLSAAIGDSGGDGPKELYAAGSQYTGACCPNINVWRVGFTTPPPPGTFDATFSSVRGNEWWIQANVAASGGTLAKVDVRLNGGDWKPLAKQSWGGWAASYRAVQGTIVQLRATGTTGATDLSDCYQWIPASNADATKVQCGSSPPPPTGFDATFSSVKGNEWWVQANVAGNQPIAKVEARVDCGGTWHTLTLQSWGGYAKSFHVPNGAKVDFRATSSTGATDRSGGYIWPQATPTGAC